MHPALIRLAAACLVFVAMASAPAGAQFTPAVPQVVPSLNVLGWSDYIDPGVMEEFGKASSLRVVYDVFDSEPAFEARFAEARGFYDIILVPARLLPKLVAAGQLQKLDRTVVPLARDLWPEVGGKLAALDPGGQYALVHMWFTYGLAYDVKQAAERLPEAQLASWDVLFRPESLKKFTTCGVQLPDEPDLLLGLSLLAQKLAPDLRNPADLKRAADHAGRLRPLVSEFRNGGAAAALADGETCLALATSTEAGQARERGKVAEPPRDIGFILPREAVALAIDVLAIPKDAPHGAEAMRFAALLARPEVAARNSTLTHLANGVSASRGLLPPALRADRVLWPEDEAIKRMVLLPLPDPTLRKAIEREWLRIKTGSFEPVPVESAGKAPKVRPKPGAPVPPQVAVPEKVRKKPRRPGEKAKG